MLPTDKPLSEGFLVTYIGGAGVSFRRSLVQQGNERRKKVWQEPLKAKPTITASQAWK